MAKATLLRERLDRAMKPYAEMSREELENEIALLKKEYHKYQAMGIHL